MTEISDAEKQQIKEMLKTTRDAPKTERPEMPAEQKKPAKPPEPAEEEEEEEDASVDTEIDELHQKEANILKLEKRLDDKIKKFTRLVARAEMSGKTQAGQAPEKTPEQIQAERIKKRFSGTGIETYIQ